MRNTIVMSRFHTLSMLSCLLLALAACDATVELVKAPFDATIAVSNGTTQASSEFTQPTKEFTSSTTPGSRVANDSSIRAKQRVYTFAAYNFGNVQHEIAQGRGEYLTSLATLAEISPDKQPEFFQRLQGQYDKLYVTDREPAEITRNLVDVVWATPIGTHND